MIYADWYYVPATLVPVIKSSPRVDHLIAIATDISEQKLQKAYDEAQSAFP